MVAVLPSRTESNATIGPGTLSALSMAREAGYPDALWLWNGTPTAELLRRQLNAARAGGLKTLAVWPWAGLETPLFQAAHLEAVTAACDAAEEEGVSLWLAGDIHWPSGSAGGRLLVERPDLAQRALACWSRWVSSEHPLTVTWRGEGERLVMAQALDDAGARRDLTPQLEGGGRPHHERHVATYGGYRATWETRVWDVALRLPPGEWFIAIATLVRTHPLLPAAIGCAWSSGSTGTLDALSSTAVEAYATHALEPLWKAAGRHVGSTVRGIAVVPPEPLSRYAPPAAGSWHVDVLPWLHDMPELFERLFERQLETHLPYALSPLHEAPPQPSAPLDRWREVAQERLTETFGGTLARWCSARGMHLLSMDVTDLARLPQAPLTLRAERKRAVDPLRTLALADTGAHVIAGGRAEGEAEPGWRPLDVFGPEWEWRAASRNWLSLGEWAEWKHGARGRDGTTRFEVRCAFDVDYTAENLALVYEAGVVEAVTLNGSPLPLAADRVPASQELEFADDCHRVTPLRADALRYGANTVRAVARLGPGDRVLLESGATAGPLALIGAFALRPAGASTGRRAATERWRMVRPGSFVSLGNWRDAGFPRFAGTVTYAQTVRIPALAAGAELRLVARARHCWVALALDGRPISPTRADPWQFALHGAAREGLNRIELTCVSGMAQRLATGMTAGLDAVALEYRRPR